jgi:hypothetical protein
VNEPETEGGALTTPAEATQPAETEPPAEPTKCQRLGEWFWPPRSPSPRRYAETSEDLLARLGNPPQEVVATMLDEALAACAEVAERVDSAERRAATIQGAIAIAASLTLAGGSLLLTKKLASQGWTIAFATGFGATVVSFAIAAWRSVLVTWPRFMWASPAVIDIADDHARATSPKEVQLKRTRDLLIAYGRRDSVAQVKIRLLGSAFRWMLLALILIAVLAGLFAAHAISHTSTHSTGSHKIRTTITSSTSTPERQPAGG